MTVRRASKLTNTEHEMEMENHDHLKHRHTRVNERINQSEAYTCLEQCSKIEYSERGSKIQFKQNNIVYASENQV